MPIKSDDIAPPNHHRQERERIHFALLEEAARGLEDIRDGRVATAFEVLRKHRIKRKR